MSGQWAGVGEMKRMKILLGAVVGLAIRRPVRWLIRR